jgi:quercetin dioxygenase-like cupin family protein
VNKRQLISLTGIATLAAVATSLASGVTTLEVTTGATVNYTYATQGILNKGIWKLLLDESNLGGKELELAEVTITAGTTVDSHTHASLEVIYVLSGTYLHEVNGHLYALAPGMVGVVRPGDRVRHIAPRDGDTKLLVMWVPGGEHAFGRAQATMIPSLPELTQRK